jgi:hypothetical protein
VTRLAGHPPAANNLWNERGRPSLGIKYEPVARKKARPELSCASHARSRPPERCALSCPSKIAAEPCGVGPAIFRQACAIGLEEIVSKRLSAPYRSGPSRDWLKMLRAREREWWTRHGPRRRDRSLRGLFLFISCMTRVARFLTALGKRRQVVLAAPNARGPMLGKRWQGA